VPVRTHVSLARGSGASGADLAKLDLCNFLNLWAEEDLERSGRAGVSVVLMVASKRYTHGRRTGQRSGFGVPVRTWRALWFSLSRAGGAFVNIAAHCGRFRRNIGGGQGGRRQNRHLGGMAKGQAKSGMAQQRLCAALRYTYLRPATRAPHLFAPPHSFRNVSNRRTVRDAATACRRRAAVCRLVPVLVGEQDCRRMAAAGCVSDVVRAVKHA